MASWRKLLAQMVADPDPGSHTFDEAAGVLGHLEFNLAKPTKGSHRRFRRTVEDSTQPSGTRTIIIGLVQSGKGTLKPIYITEMVRVLQENHLLPEGVE